MYVLQIFLNKFNCIRNLFTFVIAGWPLSIKIIVSMRTISIPTHSLLKKFTCFFIGHKPIYGHFVDHTGNYYYNFKCNRCGIFLGLPHMKIKYIHIKFPIPKIVIRNP